MSSLSRLLRPKSIAVIGGGAWCENVITQSLKMGYKGKIYPVHPNKPTLGGLKTYATLTDLPTAPDAAFIGVNRHATIDITRTLNTLGAGGAVCFASGFSEATQEDATADDLQTALLNAADKMTIIGPNCYGFINYLDGALLWPDQHGGQRVERGVAIITQSSNIAINLSMQKRGLPIAYIVTAGNQAQTGLSALGAALLDDDRVTALGLHIEGLDDLAAFEALATKAHKLKKSIVVLKVGKSQQAQSAALSHTASISGSSAGAAALFARLGVAQVHGLADMLETLKLFHTLGEVAGNALASVSCSGGEASLVADIAQDLGLQFPPLTATQETALRDALGPLVRLANPLDYHTYIWGDTGAMTRTFTAMMGADLAPDLALGLVILDIPRDDRCVPDDWLDIIPCVENTARATGIPMAIVSTLSDTMPEDLVRELMSKNILAIGGIEGAMVAIKAGIFIGQYRAEDSPAPLLPPIMPVKPVVLPEHTAKEILHKHGMPIPASKIAHSPAEAGVIAEKIGFPVVLKGQGFAHKTEANAVVLNLQTATAVQTAAEQMNTDIFLVEQMITDGVTELLVGVVCDPAHGYVLTIGAGGTLTELLADTCTCLIPASRQTLATALKTLKCAPILAGWRGAVGADEEAILDAICALQNYVLAHHGTVQEAEINPLICTPTTAICADALIVANAPNK